jgi:hypothetical protein
MSRSGELSRLTRKLCTTRGLTVEAAAAVPAPEREPAAFLGPIAASDTYLIDGNREIVDLAGEIIRQHQT